MLLVTLLVESVTEVKTTPAVMLLVSDAGGVYVTLEPVCTVEAESEPQPAQFSATVALPEPESLVIVGVKEIVAPPAVVLALDILGAAHLFGDLRAPANFLQFFEPGHLCLRALILASSDLNVARQ